MSAQPARDPQWEALCALFGQPHVPQTRNLYNKVCKDLKAGHYTEDQIVRAGRLYQRDHKDWAFTPAALLKHIDQLLHIDRRPATSVVSHVDDRPGISLREYAQTPEGKADPNLEALRQLWRRQHRSA